MSLQSVQGKNVNIYIKNDTDSLFYPYACATKINAHFETELILMTSPGAGRAKKYMPRSTDGTVTLEGVTTILPVAMWSVFDLLEKCTRGDYVTMYLEFVSNAGDRKTLDLYTLARSVDFSDEADGHAMNTVEFQMSGAPGVFTPPVIGGGSTGGGTGSGGGTGGTGGGTGGGITGTAGLVLLGTYSGSGTTWNDAATVGKRLIIAFRQIPLDIIYTGTPTPSQILRNDTTGDFAISSPLDAGPPHETIYYLYQ